jgi:branched-subunit amino acid aminotransferase/4-amino-4-deoxychorismate lyase
MNNLAEGAITNVFIRKDKAWQTPALDCGILPGVLRRYLLEKNTDIIEKKITYKEFLEADEILLTNSLRGEIKVEQLFLDGGEVKYF